MQGLNKRSSPLYRDEANTLDSLCIAKSRLSHMRKAAKNHEGIQQELAPLTQHPIIQKIVQIFPITIFSQRLS